MNLDISKGYLLPQEAISFVVETELPPQNVLGEDITFDTVTIHGHYTVTTDDTVTIEGILNTNAHARCAMCLSPVQVPMEIDFNEFFRKIPQEQAEDVFVFEKKSLPLDQMIITLILLHLPMRFECSDSCSEDISSYVMNGDDITHPEEGDAAADNNTYQPFAQLGNMLEEHNKKN